MEYKVVTTEEKQVAEVKVLKQTEGEVPSKKEGGGSQQVFHDALEEVGGNIIDLAELEKQAQEE
jgi:hypothetical protein